MKKKMTESRLRAIAMMIKQGMSTPLIALVAGLPHQSAAELVWIYKWPQKKLEEMIERGKLCGGFSDVARNRVRKYFAMHPDQRPAPQVERPASAKNETVEDEARDLGNVHARLDLLARCSGDQNERLMKVERSLGELRQASCLELLPATAARLANCEKQIARLQEDLEGVAHWLELTLPSEGK